MSENPEKPAQPHVERSSDPFVTIIDERGTMFGIKVSEIRCWHHETENHYLSNRQFVVVTDKRTCKWDDNEKGPDGKYTNAVAKRFLDIIGMCHPILIVDLRK